MSDESKKDIASHYAYRTFWACMRVPVVLRLPIALVGTIGCAVKIAENIVEQRRHDAARVSMPVETTGGDPFAGAFDAD